MKVPGVELGRDLGRSPSRPASRGWRSVVAQTASPPTRDLEVPTPCRGRPAIDGPSRSPRRWGRCRPPRRPRPSRHPPRSTRRSAPSVAPGVAEGDPPGPPRRAQGRSGPPRRSRPWRPTAIRRRAPGRSRARRCRAVRVTVRVPASITGDRAVARVADPDALVVGGDRHRARAGRDGGDDLVRRRVDRHDGREGHAISTPPESRVSARTSDRGHHAAPPPTAASDQSFAVGGPCAAPRWVAGAGSDRRRVADGAAELGVLGQDRAVRPRELGAGVDAELGGEDPPAVAS